MHNMTETQRRLRGHDFLPPPGERGRIPGERATEGVPLAEKVICIHYFCASADWWIAEIWPEDGLWMAFGYAQFASMPECAEWGQISLNELEELRVMAGPLPVLSQGTVPDLIDSCPSGTLVSLQFARYVIIGCPHRQHPRPERCHGY